VILLPADGMVEDFAEDAHNEEAVEAARPALLGESGQDFLFAPSVVKGGGLGRFVVRDLVDELLSLGQRLDDPIVEAVKVRSQIFQVRRHRHSPGKKNADSREPALVVSFPWYLRNYAMAGLPPAAKKLK